MNKRIEFNDIFKILSTYRNNSLYIFISELFHEFTGKKRSVASLDFDANPNTLKAKAYGRRSITKKEAKELIENYNYDDLETFLNDLIPDSELQIVRNKLSTLGFDLDLFEDSEIPSACAIIIHKIILDISREIDESIASIDIDKKVSLIDTLKYKYHYYDGRFYKKGKLLEKVEKETIAIRKKEIVLPKEIVTYLNNRAKNNCTYTQNIIDDYYKYYLAAKRTEACIYDQFSDGRKAFKELKEEVKAVIYECFTSKRNNENCIIAAMEKITSINLNSSLLNNIIGLITNVAIKGVVLLVIEEDECFLDQSEIMI